LKSFLLCVVSILIGMVLFLSCASDDGPPSESSLSAIVDNSIPSAPNVDEVIRFRTEDSEDLWGSIFGTGEIGVILTHMRGRDQTSWFPFGRFAAESGYKVLTFDFRGYGKSTGTKDTRMNRDLEAAVAYMRAKGAKEIILIGASMGGTSSIDLASELQIQGVAALSPPAVFGRIDALSAVESMVIPLLLIVAENDSPYYSDARKIESAAAATQFLALTGQQHGTNLLIDHRNEVFANLLAFIDRWSDDRLQSVAQTES
jgi:pimeloyl-ACP methyl ester carboxylesterase